MTPTIMCEVQRTRRLTWSHVFSENAELLFSSKTMSNCILWCIDAGHSEILLDMGDKLVCIDCKGMVSGITDPIVAKIFALESFKHGTSGV